MKMGLLLLLAMLVSSQNIFLINTTSREDYPPQIEESILLNGDFEEGTVSPWNGIDETSLSSAEAHQGAYSIKISNGEEAYQEVKVIPREQYTLTAWFKWNSFDDRDWGYDHISVLDQNLNEISTLTQLHKNYARYDWHKVAITFVARSEMIRVSFGVFGPNENIELFFDDFRLFPKSQNIPPKINPDSDRREGAAPLSIQFSSNSEDTDGAVSYHFWDFGDGSTSTLSDPIHTYLQRGDYAVSLTAIDNDGDQKTKQLTITVRDELAPVITLNIAEDTIQTKSSAIEINGKAIASAGREISDLVWDNINTDEAKQIDFTPGSMVFWSTNSIKLKPGANVILFTATDTEGVVSTQKAEIFREIEQPEVFNISLNASEMFVYEKLEIQFDLLTTASTPFFIYDESPPAGVPPQTGVTVEGRFVDQEGQSYKQPGFFTKNVEVINGQYHEMPEGSWSIRFSPQKAGEYQAYIYVKDSSGETTHYVGKFIANPPEKPGYIQVSQADSRYFEFSNEELFWPIGPAYEDDLSKNLLSGMNFSRIWMAGKGVYSSNFARWVSSSKEMGNEGFDSQLSYTEHFPGHEISQEIFHPEGSRIWIGWPDTEINGPKFKANTDYLVKIRLKTQGITGPIDPDIPYGFMIKRHGWPSENLEISLRSTPSLIPIVENDRDWHTILATYHSGETSFYAVPYISLYLDNVTGGEVFIDQFSIKEILPDNQLGEELIINSKSDLHTYASSKPAKYFDDLIEQGEQNQVYFKFVVQDKRDWINNHLTQYGYFHPNGDGYFQSENTKSRWLLEQWWRYLAARWGYSTAIHSWELINEGPPGDPHHYQMAEEFARFMHETDAHPHLATTSFWSGWEVDFWGNNLDYPDIDYADLHVYAQQDSPAAADETAWILETQQLVYTKLVQMPIISGETGLFTPESDLFSLLESTNPGIWYHNMLWAQLSPQVVFMPNYWWSSHLNAIPRQKITPPFTAFIEEIPLNLGGFLDIRAAWDNDHFRVLGQKNLSLNFAYLWVQNTGHTWRNTSTTPESTRILIQMTPTTEYKIETWNTYTGKIQDTFKAISDSDGGLEIPVDQLSTDLALKIIQSNIPEKDSP